MPSLSQPENGTGSTEECRYTLSRIAETHSTAQSHAYTMGQGLWCSLTASEIWGSCHIGKSIQVDDVNNRADHPCGVLESRNKRTCDFRSHHSASGQRVAQSLGSTKQMEISVVILVVWWLVMDMCPSLPPPLSQQFKPRLNGSRGASGHVTKRGWAGGQLGRAKRLQDANLYLPFAHSLVYSPLTSLQYTSLNFKSQVTNGHLKWGKKPTTGQAA